VALFLLPDTCTTTEVAVHCEGCRRWLTGVVSKYAEMRLKCPKCRAHYLYVVVEDKVTITRKITT
jgi:Zn finger protein HypA/HybF involved in hydrogenase expression